MLATKDATPNHRKQEREQSRIDPGIECSSFFIAFLMSAAISSQQEQSGLSFVCRASRLQHANFKLWHVRIESRSFECLSDCISSLNRIDNLVDPQSRSPVTRIGLLVIRAL